MKWYYGGKTIYPYWTDIKCLLLIYFFYIFGGHGDKKVKKKGSCPGETLGWLGKKH